MCVCATPTLTSIAMPVFAKTCRLSPLAEDLKAAILQLRSVDTFPSVLDVVPTCLYLVVIGITNCFPLTSKVKPPGCSVTNAKSLAAASRPSPFHEMRQAFPFAQY